MLVIKATNEELYSEMIAEEPNLDNLSYNSYANTLSGSISFYISVEAQEEYGYNQSYYVSNGEFSGLDFEEQFGFVIVWAAE